MLSGLDFFKLAIQPPVWIFFLLVWGCSAPVSNSEIRKIVMPQQNCGKEREVVIVPEDCCNEAIQIITKMPENFKGEKQVFEICETVFLYQFEHNAAHGYAHPKIYYLSIFEVDPPPEFIGEFKENFPFVEKESKRSQASREIRNGIYVHDRAISFSIDKICYINECVIDVFATMYEGPLSASGNKYRLIKKGKKWVVIKDTLIWIS